ncbi:MAG TPA: PIN domain-containing protein [Agriterribacter sp.]|nr:PIN domain-containing protein [Agriterribacter sp.]
MKHILIDTDIILDFFFDREPFSDHAEQLLALCESKRIKGFVTPVICSNLYYLLRQTASHNKVIDTLKKLLLIIDVLPMDKQVALKALHSNFTDFEDALQSFACSENGNIDVIITRNIKDYKNSAISVFTPGSFLRMETLY